MFEFIRNHQKLMQVLLVLLIAPSFALVGIGSYSSFNDSPNNVAKIDGYVITRDEWDQAVRRQQARIAQALGDRYDAKLFDTPEARKSILDGLIGERTAAYTATRQHLAVSDAGVRQVLLGERELIKPDGTFDREKYQSLLAAQGLTERQYESQVRSTLASKQVMDAVQASSFEPKSVLTRLNMINEQQRSVQAQIFSFDAYRKNVTVPDAEIQQYYDRHAAELTVPQHLDVQYLVLDGQAVLKSMVVPDQDVQKYYDANKSKYQTKELRDASHILFSVEKGASDSAVAAIRAKAENVLKEVKAHPAQFAQLARDNSQDPSTAKDGGELGSFSQGDMVPAFDSAVFSMKEGDISSLVQTQYGFHIIRLNKVMAANVRPIGDVREQITQQLKNQQATEKFASLAESFKNAVYEQADSLQPVADKFHLVIQNVNDLKRAVDPAAKPGTPYNSEAFLSAVFDPKVASGHENTQPIEVAPQVLVAAHVVKNVPAARPPLDLVKAVIHEKLETAQAKKLARDAADGRIKTLRIKDDSTGFSAEQTISRTVNGTLSADVRDVLMQAPASALPAFVTHVDPGKDVVVYRINKVAQPVNADLAKRTQSDQQSEMTFAKMVSDAYLNALKREANVKLYKAATTKSAPAADDSGA